jgi:hypothetical protein
VPAADIPNGTTFDVSPKVPISHASLPYNRLASKPPILRDATDRALPRRLDAEGQLSVGRQWPIPANPGLFHGINPVPESRDYCGGDRFYRRSALNWKI